MIRRDIISSESAGERSVTETEMIRSRFLEIARSSTWSLEDENEMSQKIEGKCRQALHRNNLLSIWQLFSETFLEPCRGQTLRSYLVFTFPPVHKVYLRASNSIE